MIKPLRLNWGFVLSDAFGNAIGNSIVKGLSSEGTFSAKEQAELDRKVAKVGNKELANLDTRVRSGLQQNTNSMANDIGDRTAAEGASAFDVNVLAQLNAADMVMDSSLNKRLGAVDGYLDMSRKTLRDTQAIDTRAETNRQQRALQASKIQQRYDQKLMDFRMDNPVYSSPQPLFDYDSALGTIRVRSCLLPFVAIELGFNHLHHQLGKPTWPGRSDWNLQGRFTTLQAAVTSAKLFIGKIMIFRRF